MSSPIQPIRVYGQGPSPNPLKVAIILKELDLSYEIIHIPFTDVKKPEYLSINPNGRLPAIHDPNTGITLWESGAIIEYLVERYDTEHHLGFTPGTPEYYHAKQWLYFQTSGQGPYYGQMTWFLKFHPEQVPSAVDRYANEINRVTGVLEGHLAKQKQERGTTIGDGPWLVGGKLSYADMAFITWQRMVNKFATKEQFDEDKFPHVKEWLQKMVSRDSTTAAIAESPSAPS